MTRSVPSNVTIARASVANHRGMRRPSSPTRVTNPPNASAVMPCPGRMWRVRKSRSAASMAGTDADPSTTTIDRRASRSVVTLPLATPTIMSTTAWRSVRAEPADGPEVDQAERPVVEQQDVARMGVGVKEAGVEEVPEKGA